MSLKRTKDSSAVQPTGVRSEKADANRACLDQGVIDLLPLVVVGVERTINADGRDPGA